MAKTYNTFTNVSTGDVLTATNFNNVLTNVGNYRVPPMARIHRAAALSHTSTGNFQTISFDTETFTNTDGMWAAGTPTRLTFTTAGVYLITCNVNFATNATGTRALELRVNAAATQIAYVDATASANLTNGLTATTLYSAAVNDYVYPQAFQNSTANLAYSVGQGQLSLSVVWVGQAS